MISDINYFVNIYYGQNLSKDQSLIIGLALSPKNNGRYNKLGESLNCHQAKCQVPKVNIILKRVNKRNFVKKYKNTPEISKILDYGRKWNSSGIIYGDNFDDFCCNKHIQLYSLERKRSTVS